MSKAFDYFVGSIDMRRRFLVLLQSTAPKFYREFVNHFVTDKVTFTGIEKDFIKALAHAKDIQVFATFKNEVAVENAEGNTMEYPNYAEAFDEILALIKEPPTPRFFATEIRALNKFGEVKTYEGKPVHAGSVEEAQEICDRTMPYARAVEEPSPMSDLANKAL